MSSGGIQNFQDCKFVWQRLKKKLKIYLCEMHERIYINYTKNYKGSVI